MTPNLDDIGKVDFRQPGVVNNARTPIKTSSEEGIHSMMGVKSYTAEQVRRGENRPGREIVSPEEKSINAISVGEEAYEEAMAAANRNIGPLPKAGRPKPPSAPVGAEIAPESIADGETPTFPPAPTTEEPKTEPPDQVPVHDLTAEVVSETLKNLTVVQLKGIGEIAEIDQNAAKKAKKADIIAMIEKAILGTEKGKPIVAAIVEFSTDEETMLQKIGVE